MVKFRIIFAIFLLFLIQGQVWANTIASVATEHVIGNYSIKNPPRQIFFDLTQINQAGQYAVLRSPTYYADGSNTFDSIEDLVYILCLEQGAGGTWTLIYDLSRSDVPSSEELAEIKSSFPEKFPKKLLSNFWQKLLK